MRPISIPVNRPASLTKGQGVPWPGHRASSSWAGFPFLLFLLWAALVPTWVLAQAPAPGLTDEAVFRADFREPENQQFSVWPNIPLISATYMEEYVMDRHLFSKLHVLESDPPTVLAAISAIDTIYTHHQAKALAKLGVSFNAEFIGALAQLARDHHIATPKLYFSFEGISPDQIQRDISADKPLLDRLSKRAERITMVAYAHYTKLPGQAVRVTLTLVKLKTGQSQSFTVTCAVADMGRSLAEAVFHYFQGNRFPEFQNIVQANLEWLLPAQAHRGQMTSKSAADMYCRSQGARLPTEAEIIKAEAAGPYHNGVALLSDSYYHLAGGIFYYSSPTTDLRGRAHEWAGRATNDAYYYCVRQKKVAK